MRGAECGLGVAGCAPALPGGAPAAAAAAAGGRPRSTRGPNPAPAPAPGPNPGPRPGPNPGPVPSPNPSPNPNPDPWRLPPDRSAAGAEPGPRSGARRCSAGSRNRTPAFKQPPMPSAACSPSAPTLGESQSPTTPAAESFIRGGGKPSRPFVHLAGFLLAQAIGKG